MSATPQVLGAGRYTVTISDWSGRPVWQSTASTLRSVEWGREINEMSKATARVAMPAAVVNLVEPWLHLFTVYRSGLLVWHGVITRVIASGRSVTCEACDGAVMFSRRRIPMNRWWAQHDATQVMSTMVQDACGYKDPVGMCTSMVTRASRIWVTASYVAAESMLDDVVDDLVGQGLTWTISAGRLLIGPVAARYQCAQISDMHLDGDLTVIKDGAGCVTDMLVTGKGVWGQWGAHDSAVGLLQGMEKADGCVREEECVRQARRAVEGRGLPARRIDVGGGARLLPTAPVTIDELVPGVAIPVASAQSGITVGAVMALRSVAVKVDESGERVTIGLGDVAPEDDPVEFPDPADLDWRSPYEKESSKSAPDDGANHVGVPPT